MTNYEKYKDYYKEYYDKNKKERCEYRKKYYQDNKGIIKLKKSEWYNVNKEEILKNQSKRRIKNHDQCSITERSYRQRLKEKVLTHYGNNILSCVLCGHNKMTSLSIDHIYGDGRSHRRSIKNNGGAGFYQWLIRNNFPEGFRTLCMNCQFDERESMRAGAVLQKSS